MAIRPDYVTGTITLASGSANFTTSGSALQAAAVQAGDEIITRSGNVLIIASITGQNSGTLMQVCPAAAAGSAQPLRIRFQPDGSRYQGAARDLIEKLASGNVDALAGLTGAADRGIMFDGPGTMTLFALTAFARSMLDDASASDVLTTLGFSAFAKTIIDDTTGAAMWATMGATQQNGTSGYVKLPSGLIIQWGRNFGAGDRSVTLPVSFTSTTFVKVAAGEYSSGTTTATMVVNITNQSFLTTIDLLPRLVSNGGTVASAPNAVVTWIAIGV